MKKLLLALMFLAGAAITTNESFAQVRVNVNIGSQPMWGPSGYTNAQNYYFPDMDAYYNIDRRQFVYYERGRWVFSSSLPPRYRNYDLYNSYKVVINERDPWIRNRAYNRQYRNYRGHKGQAVIRDSRDNRYWANPNHPRHNEFERTGAKSGDIQPRPLRR